MAADLTAGFSAAQVREAERPLLAAGVPLMDRAAAGLATACLPLFGRRPGRSVLVLAGSGNNGGDALLAAAHLARRGCAVTVLRLGRRIHARGLHAVVGAGGVVLPPDTSASAAAALAADSDVVLDGVLGTGAAGGLRDPLRPMIASIAAAVAGGPAQVVAVDLPSGLDPDSGSMSPPILRAALTVTFGAGKAGLLRGDGPGAAGVVRLVDIGLGAQLDGVRALVAGTRPLPGGRAANGGTVLSVRSGRRKEPHA